MSSSLSPASMSVTILVAGRGVKKIILEKDVDRGRGRA